MAESKVVSMSNLLEAGVHFGHQTKRWNPKMKEYIFTSRDDIYIIDLEKTVTCIEKAYEEIKKIAENGGSFLFVGTKKQAVEASIEEATRSESFYVTERWLGGTLTNFRTIRRRIKRLEEIENMETNGMFDALPKKEVIALKKEYDNPKKEINAIREARKLNIPVFGLVDTNCDPDDVDYVIPGNDDAVRSVKVVLGVLTNAICEAKGLEIVDYVSEDDKPKKDFKKEIEKTEERNESKEETIEEVKEEKEASNELDGKTVTELRALAKEAGVKGYSTMKKDELIASLS